MTREAGLEAVLSPAVLLANATNLYLEAGKEKRYRPGCLGSP